MLLNLALVFWVVLFAPTQADPFEEIRALDSAASFELDSIAGRCQGGGADPQAAAAATRAAYIHRTRIGLARERAQATGEEVAALAVQAADAHLRAHACAPAPAHLEAAREVLVTVRAQVADPTSGAAQALDRRIGDLSAQLQSSPRVDESAQVRESPRVEFVAVEAKVQPGPRNTYLGRLALRLEGGLALARAGGSPSGFFHRGAAGRLAVLARHPVGVRSHLLFGPAFTAARLGDVRGPSSSPLTGDLTLIRLGAPLEAEIAPSARASWLTIHPSVEVGLEVQSYVRRSGQRGASSALQVGGGLAVCVWRAALCPSARATVVPVLHGGVVVTLLLGLSVDVIRAIDGRVTRLSARRQSPRAHTRGDR